MRNIELRLEMGGMQGRKPFGFESLDSYYAKNKTDIQKGCLLYFGAP